MVMAILYFLASENSKMRGWIVYKMNKMTKQLIIFEKKSNKSIELRMYLMIRNTNRE